MLLEQEKEDNKLEQALDDFDDEVKEERQELREQTNKKKLLFANERLDRKLED